MIFCGCFSLYWNISAKQSTLGLTTQWILSLHKPQDSIQSELYGYASFSLGNSADTSTTLTGKHKEHKTDFNVVIVYQEESKEIILVGNSATGDKDCRDLVDSVKLTGNKSSSINLSRSQSQANKEVLHYAR